MCGAGALAREMHGAPNSSQHKNSRHASNREGHDFQSCRLRLNKNAGL